MRTSPAIQPLAVFVIAACAVNALAGPVVVASTASGDNPFTASPSLNVIIIISILGGLARIWSAPRRTASLLEITVVLAIMAALMLPSSLFAWALMCCVAVACYPRLGQSAKAGCVVLAAAAAREPIADIALKLFATPVLTFDAILAEFLLNVSGIGGAREGNIVMGADGHQLLILSGCASFSNLSVGILGWFAATRLCVNQLKLRHYMAGLALGIMILAMNTLRLFLMALGKAEYTLVHDGWGPIVFDSTVTVMAVGLIWWSLRHDVESGPFVGFPTRLSAG